MSAQRVHLRKRPRVEDEEQTGTKRTKQAEDQDMESETESEEVGDLSQLCTQDEKVATKKSDLPNLKEADGGVIEKVKLTNFMCHRVQEVDFNPHVNFILGRNGSGKSAIMAGIVVALGGKATTTLRASSLKQFIRTGCTTSEVMVRLRNRGTEAFKHSEYGDSITVERQLRTDGSGSYKIKGARGNVVSTKKEELVSILDHYNIQIDNPVSLLNQDTSRHFLHSSKPQDKYRLFMKATHLEQIAHDYENAQESQALMRKGIQRKKELLPDYERKAKELEEQVQVFQRLREIEEKVQDLEMELQWALVTEIENKIPPVEVEAEKERRRIPRNQTRAQLAEEEVSKAEEDLRGIREELEKAVGEAGDANKRRSTLYGEKRTKDKEIRDTEGALKSTKREIAGKAKEKEALEQKKEECIALSQRDTRGEREERLRQLERCQEQQRRITSELETVANDRRQFEHAMDDCVKGIKANKSQLADVDSKVRGSEEKLRRLNSSRSDQLETFGPWMRKLVDALRQNQHRFRKPPKGPIGAMMRLKDYKWKVAIEKVMGRDLLYTFITDNSFDDEVFKQVMRGVMRDYPRVPKPDTIRSRFEGQVYNVSAKKARGPYPTVLDLLDVQDPDILNTLIDQRGVESVLLIESKAQARHVMERERPYNARAAFTIEGDQVMAGQYYSNKFRPLGIIRASVDAAIREEDANLHQLMDERDRLRQEGRMMHEEVARLKRRLSEARSHAMRKQDERNRLQMTISELQNAEEEEESPEDTATYESEIQECDERIRELQTQKSSQEDSIRQLKEERRDIERTISDFEAEVEKITSKMEELGTHVSQAERNKRRAEGQVKLFQDRVKIIEDKVKDLEAKAAELRQKALEAAEAASSVCERMEVQRAPKSIESEISRLKRRLQQEEPRLGQREEVERQYVEAMELYEKTQQAVRKEMKALKELNHSLAKRVKGYEELKENIALRACLYFSHFLQRRDYEGKLRINHKENKLTIQVQVDTHSQASQATKNTKSLSGGERSFSTVCFIMSLWDAIDAPFRCLDEFDVFMDMINRQLSMRLMMEFAGNQPNKQFIFFTPQDMSAMGIKPGGANIKVLQLREPERGQTTLD